jgi:hypothetical protein
MNFSHASLIVLMNDPRRRTFLESAVQRPASWLTLSSAEPRFDTKVIPPALLLWVKNPIHFGSQSLAKVAPTTSGTAFALIDSQQNSDNDLRRALTYPRIRNIQMNTIPRTFIRWIKPIPARKCPSNRDHHERFESFRQCIGAR